MTMNMLTICASVLIGLSIVCYTITEVTSNAEYTKRIRIAFENTDLDGLDPDKINEYFKKLADEFEADDEVS